ncbi:MAG TPA: helix-turn-helix transcriptional regulator [Gemmataceae bacterium]|nr:helix-turn-helix transcriptional regulator [Gemmataceae bacterium]
MNHSFPNQEVRDEQLEACQGFAAIWPRYLGCSTPVQGVVRDLVQLFNDPAIEAEERQRILRALAVTLYQHADDRPPKHKEPSPARPTVPEEETWRRRLEQEEEVFVANLKRLMSERRLTQADLAQRAGLSQPAISMMLARKYRPQRRTVRLLAQVLGVHESELWPEHAPKDGDSPPNGAGSAAAPPFVPTVDPAA